VTIHNDAKFPVDVAIHLKGGIRLCGKSLNPGEAWVKVDGGLSATCPYDVKVMEQGHEETQWVRHFFAPSLKGQLDVYLSTVITDQYLMQRKVVDKAMHQRTEIAKRWVRDEERSMCVRCRRQFGIYWRKHHCRICGDIFCDSCSRFRVLTALHPTMPARACFRCYEIHASPDEERRRIRAAAAAAAGDDKENAEIAEPLAEEAKSRSVVAAAGAESPTTLNAPQPRSVWGHTLDSVACLLSELKNEIADMEVAGVLAFGVVVWLVSLATMCLWAEVVSMGGMLTGVWPSLVLPEKPPSATIQLALAATAAALATGSLVVLKCGLGKGKDVVVDESDIKHAGNNTPEAAGHDATPRAPTMPCPDAKDAPGLTKIQQVWVKEAQDAAQELWEWTVSHKGWRQRRSGATKVWARVETRGGVRAFKAMAKVNASAESVFQLLSDAKNTPKWNKALQEYQVLENLGEGIDLTHAVAPPVGPISSRDFIQVRVVKRIPPTSPENAKARGGGIGGYVIAGCSVEGANIPARPGIVRGFNYTNGYVVLEGSGEEEDDDEKEKKKGRRMATTTDADEGSSSSSSSSASSSPSSHSCCRVVWVLNVNLKGWLPASVIEASLSSTMVDFYATDLKHAVEGLRRGASGPAPSPHGAQPHADAPTPGNERRESRERSSSSASRRWKRVVSAPASSPFMVLRDKRQRESGGGGHHHHHHHHHHAPVIAEVGGNHHSHLQPPRAPKPYRRSQSRDVHHMRKRAGASAALAHASRVARARSR